MSGHSKWHNIQAKKGKADAARGKVFTKLPSHGKIPQHFCTVTRNKTTTTPMT